MYRLIAVVLFSTLAFSQAAKPAPPSAPPSAKPSSPAQSAPAAKTGDVAESAPVITIAGVCDGKVPATPSPDCKTVVSRADFEKLVNAIDPQMPTPRRQQLAEAYARMIVMSDVADERGVPNSPAAREVLRLSRMQALSQLLLRDLEKDAANVPPADLQKFYNEHPEQFEQATLARLFLPKTPPGGEKPPDEKALQAEAEKIRAAAAAGGDFEKLQKQAYDDLGIKTPPPPTAAGTQRRESAPPAQASIFDLQPGQVSQVIDEPGGLYIFKMESKKKVTLDEATPEIKRVLEQERMKNAVESITKNVKPVFNDEYFGPASGPGRPAPTLSPTPPPASQRPGASAPATPPPAKPPGQ